MDIPNNNLKTKVINSAQWKFTATVVISVLALVQLYILTKFVGTAIFGVIAIGKVALGFLTHLSDSGMRNAILVKQELTDKLFSTIYWINIGMIFAICLGTYWLVPWVSSLYEMPSLDLVLYIFILAFFISGIGTYYKALLQKNMHIKIISKIEIIAMFLGVTVAIICAIQNPNASALAYGILTQIGVSAFGYLIFGYKIHPLQWQFQHKGLNYFFSFGRYQLGERMLNYFHSKIDVLIIGKVLGAEILGVYDIFKQILNRPESLINPVLDFVALPIMSKQNVDRKSIAHIYIKMMSYSATVLFPIYGILILISPYFIQYFFGEDWVQYSYLFQLIALYFIVHSTLNHIGTLWVAVSQPELGFYWNIAVWLILPVSLFFAVQYHIEIVVIVMTLVLVLLFYPMYIFVVKKLVPISFKVYIFTLIPPLIISFIAFLPFYYITIINNGLLWSIISGLGYGILMIVLYQFFHKKVFDELKSLLTRY